MKSPFRKQHRRWRLKIWNLKSDDLATIWQQLHLSPLEPSSDMKVICISYILLTVVLCITLEPNAKLSGNFVWLDMGFPTLRRNRTPWTHPCLINSDLSCLVIYIHCTPLCSIFRFKKLFERWVIHVGEELTYRKLVIRFVLNYCTKTFSREGFDPEIYESKFI